MTDHWQALSIVSVALTLGPVVLVAAYRAALWLVAPPPRQDHDLARVVARCDRLREESRRMRADYARGR